VPTYQYRCTACSEPLEVVQSFTDPPLAQCPSCGGVLRKVFSAVGVVFKGSGFYQTDSRSRSKTETAAKDGDSAKSPAATTTADGAKEGAKDGAKARAGEKAEQGKGEKPAKKKDPAGSSSHKVA
jgi:putative FmdB family regulatory protein